MMKRKKATWTEWRIVPPKGDTEHMPYQRVFRTRDDARECLSNLLEVFNIWQGFRVVRAKTTEILPTPAGRE